MRAMLFAAGLGTRLRPLTNDRPKALVMLADKTLLEWALLKLKASGVEQVVINIHHFAGMIREFLRSKNNFGLDIFISDETDLLLDTGGGLKKVQDFFLEEDGPFLVMNVDILTTLDLKHLLKHHLQSGAVATLAVRHRKSSRYLLFDKELVLHGWKNTKTGEQIFCRPATHSSQLISLAFSGIQVLSPEIFSFMPSTPRAFSIISTYLRAGSELLIKGKLHDEDFWLDLGNPQAIEEALHRSEEWVSRIL